MLGLSAIKPAKVAPILERNQKEEGQVPINAQVPISGGAGHSLSARFAVGHESTHLGDEFTIFAERNHPDTFERINVSYESWEYGVSYNLLFRCKIRDIKEKGDVKGRAERCHHLSVRHGGIKPFGSDGYYSDHLLTDLSGVTSITPSASNYEPSFGFEYRAAHANFLPRQRGFLVSVDARYRILYDYHKAGGPSAPEDRQWSFSVALGLTQEKGVDDVPMDYVLYYYHGVNPHGQFRTDKDYNLFGLGWIFGG